MASYTSDPDHIKADTCSNPSRKVRIIAKIRGFTDQESQSVTGNSSPWISVHKIKDGDLSDKVTISFGDQPTSRKDAYEVDYCYAQNDVDLIFSREIKPLVSRGFDGLNATVIAYGARGSGKTSTIQGSAEKPGLAVLAMAETISMAEEFGQSVSVSCYEVFNDHAYDLLDPKHPEVQVLEDAQGKVNLKGLSQVSVKSISEFHKIYFSGRGSFKPTQKIPLELPQRSHKGLIIYVDTSYNGNLINLGKINFVDLAGYEDVRRNGSDGSNFVESTRINKSLYALMNVVYALNANESHVPYRGSKLTRMLQDSLGGINPVLMITCLNPSFCQDTIYTINSASRLGQGINRVLTDSLKKSKSSAKQMVLSALKDGKSSTASTTVKKQTGTRVHFLEKKVSCMVKGRKLFDEGYLSSSKQAKSRCDDASTRSQFMPDIASIPVPSLQDEETSKSEVPLATVPKDEVNFQSDDASTSLSQFMPDITSIPVPSLQDEAKSQSNDASAGQSQFIPNIDSVSVPCLQDEGVSHHNESNHFEVTPSTDRDTKALIIFEDVDDVEKKNKSLPVNEDGSRPLSERLREISNNLKLVYTSTPLCIKMPEQADTPSRGQVVCADADIVEPKTPVVEHAVGINDKWDVAKFNSPWETFHNRSSGMKNSLVQEYLKFLNTANKEELQGLKGIGEKRATYILELRDESPEPFKSLDDLQDIGLSAKQIKGMMNKVAGQLFN